jgi:hypothetical protein
MSPDAERKSVTWVVEVAFTILLTVEMLPVLLLYGLDLGAGTVAPDAEKAVVAVVGIVGLWLALLSSDAQLRRKPVRRWAGVTALALAAALGSYLMWGSAHAGFEARWVAALSGAAGAAVALHQLVRLARL